MWLHRRFSWNTKKKRECLNRLDITYISFSYNSEYSYFTMSGWHTIFDAKKKDGNKFDIFRRKSHSNFSQRKNNFHLVFWLICILYILHRTTSDLWVNIFANWFTFGIIFNPFTVHNITLFCRTLNIITKFLCVT